MLSSIRIRIPSRRYKMNDAYIAKLLEVQNRILLRQAEALEKIAKVLTEGNIDTEVRHKEAVEGEG